MTSEGDTSFFDRTSPEERSALERQWADGRLAHHHHQVLAFIREQRAEIRRLAGERRDAVSLVTALQQLISTLRTVHHPSEMRDQMREMHNEIWYCGQRGEYDTDRIKLEWVARHGSNWRRWRIKEYLFVAEHCAAELDALLGGS